MACGEGSRPEGLTKLSLLRLISVRIEIIRKTVVGRGNGVRVVESSRLWRRRGTTSIEVMRESGSFFQTV